MPTHDAGLPLPRSLPEPGATLPLELAGLALEAGGPAPFLLRGARARAHGSFDQPTVHIVCDDGGAAAIGVLDARPGAASLTPLGLVRRLDVGGSDVVERIFVPHDLSALVIEWSGEGAPLPALRIGCALHALAEGEGGIRWHAAEHALVVRDGRSCQVVALAGGMIAPPSLKPPAAASEPMSCFATSPAGAPVVRMIVATGVDPAAALGHLARSADAAGLVRARAGAIRRCRREGMSIVTPDAAVGTAFEWAGIRLRERIEAGEGSALDGLASLAAGGAGAARLALASLAARDAGAAPAGLGDAGLLLLAARVFRWTGDPGPLFAILPALKQATARATEAAPTAATDSDAAAILGVACEELAEVAGFFDPPYAAALEAAATHLRGGMPTVPAAEADRDRGLWLAVLGRLSAAPGRASVSRLIQAWNACLRAESTTGADLWTRALLAGTESGNALWDVDLEDSAGSGQPGAGNPGLGTADLPGLLVLALAHGLLGAAPDAARHRLRVRPVLPESWRTWSINNLPIADARLSLQFERTGTGWSIRAGQTEGAFPLRLILEAVVPAGGLEGARVNGRPATLDARRYGAGLLVPVQLEVDEDRRLEIDVRAETKEKSRPS